MRGRDQAQTGGRRPAGQIPASTPAAAAIAARRPVRAPRPAGAGPLQRLSRYALSAALPLALAACLRPQPRPDDWVAEVAATSGQVSIAEQTQSALLAATVGKLIRVGGRVETGEASRATLALRSGGRVRVDPLAVVEFQPQTSAGHQVTLELAQGQLQGTAAAVEAATLVIRVGGREVVLSQAAQATLSAASGSAPARLEVVFGEALVQQAEGGNAHVVAGGTLEFTVPVVGRPAPTPIPVAAGRAAAGAAPVDGGPGGPDAAGAGPLSTQDEDDALEPGAFVVRRVGGGAVQLRLAERLPFATLRGTGLRAVTVGSALRLADQARVLLGRRQGPQTLVTGPGLFVVRRDPSPRGPGIRLEGLTGDWTLSAATAIGGAAQQGKTLATVVQGVTVTPRAGFRGSSAIAVQQREQDADLRVLHGEAGLTAKDGALRTLEAGEFTVLAAGTIGPTQLPAPVALRIGEGGQTRVFVAGPTLPVTLSWRAAAGERSVVEVSRSSSFQRPLFADALRRQQLTLRLERGARETTYFWRVRPFSNTGRLGPPITGRLTLVPDTSHRALENLRPPRNLIREDYGNTTVFYQNSLPRFVFTWAPIAGAKSYAVKVVRENDVGSTLVNESTTSTALELAPGRLTEGTYLWYVVGRAGETLVRTSEHRRLRVAYDNATPDLQIIYPPNGAVVTTSTLEVRGVTMPGSTVQVNGATLQLDDSSRFQHPLTLVPGNNEIVFRVSDKRRGSSLYVRTVVRR